MDAMHVRKLAVRCHVSTDEADGARIARLFHEHATAAMDQAMAESGIDPREEICIRRLVVPARFWLGLTDAALISSWVSALALHMRRAIDQGGDGLVRYHSRAEAIVDAVRGIAHGRRERLWAWRQVGLAADESSPPAIANVLLANPAAIVVTFRTLAADALFRDAVSRMDDESLCRIAEAALACAGKAFSIESVAALRSGDVVASAAELTRESDGISQPTIAAAIARRQKAVLIASRSPLVPFVGRGQSSIRGAALAALAVLEREPALLLAGSEIVVHLLAMTRHALEQAANGIPATVSTNVPDPSSGQPLDAPPATSLSSTDDLDTGAAAAHVPAEDRRVEQAPHAGAIDEQPAAAHDAVSHSATADDRPLDLRTRAWTEWGGLLFLVNVARDVALADRALDDAVFAGRPLAWVLQQIAMVIVPATADDPAVRAFAGLPPATDRTAHALDEQAPVGDAERPALLSMARLIGEAARAGLDREGDDAALYDICARRAEIVADPGWIEARFPLEQVSIELRRAGLDVDPGYVEWLGVVMTFTYV